MKHLEHFPLHLLCLPLGIRCRKRRCPCSTWRMHRRCRISHGWFHTVHIIYGYLLLTLVMPAFGCRIILIHLFIYTSLGTLFSIGIGVLRSSRSGLSLHRGTVSLLCSRTHITSRGGLQMPRSQRQTPRPASSRPPGLTGKKFPSNQLLLVHWGRSWYL